MGQGDETRASVMPLLSAVALARVDPHADSSTPRAAADVEGEGTDRPKTNRAELLDPIDPETAGGNRLAPFLKKLYNLVSEPDTDEVIH